MKRMESVHYHRFHRGNGNNRTDNDLPSELLWVRMKRMRRSMISMARNSQNSWLDGERKKSDVDKEQNGKGAALWSFLRFKIFLWEKDKSWNEEDGVEVPEKRKGNANYWSPEKSDESVWFIAGRRFSSRATLDSYSTSSLAPRSEKSTMLICSIEKNDERKRLNYSWAVEYKIRISCSYQSKKELLESLKGMGLLSMITYNENTI